VADERRGSALGLNDYVKGLFASMETSGDISGDWLQLEESTFKDLQKRKKIRADVKFKDLIGNGSLYDEVALGYISDLMQTHKIPTVEEAALWSWRPGWYNRKGIKGNVESIPDTYKGVAGKAGKVNMQDRFKNLTSYLATTQGADNG